MRWTSREKTYYYSIAICNAIYIPDVRYFLPASSKEERGAVSYVCTSPVFTLRVCHIHVLWYLVPTNPDWRCVLGGAGCLSMINEMTSEYIIHIYQVPGTSTRAYVW